MTAPEAAGPLRTADTPRTVLRTPSPFALALRETMTRRGTTPAQVCRAVGIAGSTLHHLLQGDRTPRIDTATLLADHLDSQQLLALAIKARSGVCIVCEAPFVRGDTARNDRAYCGSRCAKASHSRRQRDATRARTLTDTRMTRQRLADHQEAVGMYCRNVCGPEGLRCPDASCPLALVTPLPKVGVGRKVA
jgi:transcriptional regulator with XRE-family HTH domain